MTTRKEVYEAIDSERDYQDRMTASVDRPDMIENLHLGDTILAMEHLLQQARAAWYSGSEPHADAMDKIRKVCGLGVKAGETLGMPHRSTK